MQQRAVARRAMRGLVAVSLAAVVVTVPPLPAPAHAEARAHAGALAQAQAHAQAETIRELQWYLDALRVDEAHEISTGEGVVVAVVDTGVAADHPDLAGQVLDGVRLLGEDDKGHVDRGNHGTGVAGLIAATGGGPNRALGVAPGAEILPVAVPADAFAGSNLAEAIRWAVDHGAHVINLSVGGQRALADEIEAVRYALAHDVVMVAAAGNLEAGDAAVGSPGNLPGVIAVSAVDRNGEFWTGGVRGPEMTLAAPGTDVFTLGNRTPEGDPGGYVSSPGGTSAAAPMVAGAAALVRSAFPDLDAPSVINRLIETAVDAGPPGHDDQYGFGRLDLIAALTEDVSPVSANPLGEPSALPALVGADESEQVAWAPQWWLLAAVGAMVLLVIAVGLVVLLVLLRRSRISRHRM